MTPIDYIFVNETDSQDVARALRRSPVSSLRHHIIVNRSGLTRRELLDKLVHLRRHNPDAKILGLSEVDPTAAYAPITVSPWMNQLRREMSNLP